ncbi:MAG: hypothetical protein EOP13_03820 [Pseudomonas sp.]|nr:MAG: hypothetical protein EOP13_03820 [Pseudomonas sp.]
MAPDVVPPSCMKRSKRTMNLSDIPRCFDRDVLEAWRATGLGWQSRMNDTLRKAMLKP